MESQVEKKNIFVPSFYLILIVKKIIQKKAKANRKISVVNGEALPKKKNSSAVVFSFQKRQW